MQLHVTNEWEEKTKSQINQKQIYPEGETLPTTWALIHLSTPVVSLGVSQVAEIVVESRVKEFIFIDDVILVFHGSNVHLVHSVKACSRLNTSEEVLDAGEVTL